MQELRDASQGVEQEAKQLQTDLQPTLQLAEDSLDISTAALEQIRNEDSVGILKNSKFSFINYVDHNIYPGARCTLTCVFHELCVNHY